MIVILSIILIIAVPNIINTSKNSSKNMDDSKINMIEKAAELYIEDNHYDIEDSSTKIIYVKDLIENNYLKKEDNNCEVGEGCIKSAVDNSSMDNKKICLCIIDKRPKAEYIGDASNCDNTVCKDGSNSSYETPSSYTLTVDYNSMYQENEKINTTYTPNNPNYFEETNVTPSGETTTSYVFTGWTHPGGVTKYPVIKLNNYSCNGATVSQISKMYQNPDGNYCFTSYCGGSNFFYNINGGGAYIVFTLYKINVTSDNATCTFNYTNNNSLDR